MVDGVPNFRLQNLEQANGLLAVTGDSITVVWGPHGSSEAGGGLLAEAAVVQEPLVTAGFLRGQCW